MLNGMRKRRSTTSVKTSQGFSLGFMTKYKMTYVIPDSDYVLFCEFTKIRDEIKTYSPNTLHSKTNKVIQENVSHLVRFSHLAKEKWDDNFIYLLSYNKAIVVKHCKAGGVSHLLYSEWVRDEPWCDRSLFNPRNPIYTVQKLKKLLGIEI